MSFVQRLVQYILMRRIHNLSEANELLMSYVPQVKELLGKDITLVRMKPLMTLLGNPQEKLNIVHVAGTSGKTSTCYYIAELLRLSGQKVGLTVSPHIDSVTERVQINGKPISDELFCKYLTNFLSITERLEIKPTYFELLMAFAYWVFDQEKVNYAVIETGLGGLHDASNVVINPNKICVITDIGIDHTHVLGKTLVEIANQKAGIIHKSNQVFMNNQPTEIMYVFETTTKQKRAKLNVLSNINLPFVDLPKFQKRNWLLAEMVYCFVQSRDLLPVLDKTKLMSSTNLSIPARMDTRQTNNHILIMDGAHNEQKTTAFVDSYKAQYKEQKADILIGLKEGKEYKTVLPKLKEICNKLIVTGFELTQDTPFKSIDPDIIAKQATEIGFNNVVTINDPIDAYNKLNSSEQKILIITGSFYLISIIRKAELTK